MQKAFAACRKNLRHSLSKPNFLKEAFFRERWQILEISTYLIPNSIVLKANQQLHKYKEFYVINQCSAFRCENWVNCNLQQHYILLPFLACCIPFGHASPCLGVLRPFWACSAPFGRAPPLLGVLRPFWACSAPFWQAPPLLGILRHF